MTAIVMIINRRITITMMTGIRKFDISSLHDLSDIPLTADDAVLVGDVVVSLFLLLTDADTVVAIDEPHVTVSVTTTLSVDTP